MAVDMNVQPLEPKEFGQKNTKPKTIVLVTMCKGWMTLLIMNVPI